MRNTGSATYARIGGVFLSFFVLLPVFCHGSKEKGKEEEPVRLSVLIREKHYSSGLQNVFTKLELEEGIAVTVETIQDDQYPTVLHARLADGTAPDVVEVSLPSLHALDPYLYFVDLSKEAWIPDLLIPPTDPYGKTFALPLNCAVSINALFYNKDLFDRYGISEPKSWNELLESCALIVKSGISIVPLALSTTESFPHTLLADAITKVLGEQGARDLVKRATDDSIDWTHERALYPVLGAYLELFKRGYVNKHHRTARVREIIHDFTRDRIAMYFGSHLVADAIIKERPGINLGACVLPITENAQDVLTGSLEVQGLAVHKKSARVATACRALSVLASAAYQNSFFEEHKGLPAFRNTTSAVIPACLSALFKSHIEKGKVIQAIDAYAQAQNTPHRASVFPDFAAYVTDPAPTAHTMLHRAQTEARRRREPVQKKE
ncbi:ABC transporter substrate-binding protein [Treponema pallidum]|uniref:Sugar ABC transporter, periplasmic binding protein (MsmE) n=7 Tax=Treponema pallidum TaxID=160 RepID=O83719_TREPA|nr:ABC transporter substrate-binding protein [Treponema pallidum]AAC65705.1 sugar ABC transporter, periplasmic binding protein (msmE) [Treponema pallidum subsp. pallidum str. Nichols]ACD71155.1 sugar ABC transporter, periplasmic binding protein [Treponema pallidum subsp. pallidum SS14]ADD72834.1 sugar ABC transporter, periplasmic binding protein [Treponema pallidum subsp. pallidum str. Chicago]AEZ57863.1 sugar ABC superfamily ATP binding cassette transporter, binding protein [Treponema pallidum